MKDSKHEASFLRAVESSARFVKVTGAGGTGKTAALVQRAARLLREGVDAREIWAVASTASAADRLRALLREEAGAQAAGVRVTTPQDLWVGMLSRPEARAATGRTPRLLADFEENVLMEDMKATGIKTKRLREMLKFFYREWTELGDEREGFLIDEEERIVHDAIKRHLKLRGALLPAELSNLACKVLRDCPEAASWRVAHVLVDDFQNCNRATQQALELASTACLFVCGNENEQVATAEPYPYPAGFANFEAEHPGAEVCTLTESLRCAPAIAAVGNALSRGAGMVAGCEANVAPEEVRSGAERAVRAVCWPHPNDEFRGVAGFVKRRTHGEDGYTEPQRIFIAVPNALWGRALSKVLRANDVRTVELVDTHVLKGDPRREDKCASIRAYTALCLAADAEDATAWRTWCGLGDYLCRSNHWCRLEDWACEHDLGIAAALARLDAADSAGEEPAFLGADILAARYREARLLLDACAGKRGFSLMNEIMGGPGDPPADLAALLDPMAGTETAAELVARARGRFEARFPEDEAVRIGLPRMACGLSFDTVIVTGMVDGFYPPTAAFGTEHDEGFQAEVKAAARRELCALVAKASSTLVLSSFQKDESNTAAALGMWVRRIRREDGRSLAVLSPSCLFDDMGDAIPGFDAKLEPLNR